MTRPTSPDGSPLPRRHVAHFLASVQWDGNTIRYTEGGRPICPNPNNPNEAGDVAEWCAAIGVAMP